MVNLPGSAPGPPHQIPEDGPLYLIGEGVRRSLAARQMGRPDIEAKELRPDGTMAHLGRVPLTRLFVDLAKESVPMDERWRGVLDGVGRGRTPPIEVIAITPEKASRLIPLRLVRLKRA